MKRILTLIMALILALSQCGSALAYATGTWPDGYEADGCPSRDAATRNDGRHSYYCSEYQDPWCESSGYAVFTCVYCGDTQTRTYPALGHEWGEWDEIRAATCTEEGEEIRYCNRCFQEQSRPIPALGHDWSDWYVEMEATCTESGSEFRYCNRCQTVEIRATAPLGHDWGEWRADRKATCTEAGEESRFCNRCQAREERDVPPLGHNWSDWKTEEEGTCVKPSLLERYCLRCGIKEWQYGPFGDHLWGEWYVSKAPTATDPGVEERVCAYDENHREEREIPPTGQPDPSAPNPVPAATVPPTDGGDEPFHDMTWVITWDEGVGEGKRYDGAILPLYYTFTNTGDCPESTRISFADELSVMQPGESVTFIVEHTVSKIAAEKGVFELSEAYWGYNFQDTEGEWQVVVNGVKSNAVEIPLTYPEGGEEMPHDMTVVVTWDEGIGEGKRYEGAVIPLYFTFTNNGDDPVRIWLYTEDATVLQSGESANYTYDWSVTSGEAAKGVVHASVDKTWIWFYDYLDAQGNWQEDSAVSNPVEIPLTYPGGAIPEPDNPELTLTFLYDDPAKDVYDPDDSVFAVYSLVNTGNVPLYVVAHFTSDGVTDYDYDERVFDPGKTDSSGWGWWTIKDGITPNTETEDLLGTVTVSYYYMGLDVETGEELCRTQTVTRTWKVGKPDEGPGPWTIPSLSAISAVQAISTGYESSDPAGYQLNEEFGTDLTTFNTGSVTIPAGTIHVYDPYDGYADTWYGHDFAAGQTITGSAAGWNWGSVTAEDVARGFIYFPPVEFSWEDPDSGEEMTAYSNPLYLPVISKTGLVLHKSLVNAPANGEYFTEGETIQWQVAVTNTSQEPIMNVSIADMGEIIGVYDQIASGETVVCPVPDYTVTEYDMLVGYVDNVAEGWGNDLQQVEHTYMSNTVLVPTKEGSPVPLPPPATGTPQMNTDPEPTPGTPETPEHPGTPGGGEDPKGPIYGYDVAATLYKTTANAPKNGEYYQLGETVDYTVTLTNTGKTALENITLYDILAGFAPIGSAGGLAPGESVNFAFSYTVSQTDIDTGYVMNFAIATYAFGGGILGTPVESNEVYVKAGENGWIPDPGTPGGGTPGDGNTVGLIPPVHFEEDKLTGGPGAGEGPVSCELQLNALGDNGADYTLHACADHTEAARNAEAAALTGEWSKACDIWRAEIEALYETLYEAGDSEGKAAVVSDRVAFDAYVAAFRAYLGDEAAAELMRLRCAELCCMVKTAPERLPESLLGDYARLMTAPADKCGREISALDGSDATVTERYDETRAQALQETRQLADSAKYGPAQENAFAQILRRWQMALDSVVNAKYKAADKETRKLIASVRVALDNVYEARKTLLGLLYADAPENAAEALSNLYKNALLDFCGK